MTCRLLSFLSISLGALLLSLSRVQPVLAEEVTLFPEQQIYPVNLADPRRVQFSGKILYFDRTSIDQGGDRRFDLKLGGRLGLLHLSRDKNDQLGWLLSLDAGFHGQFDVTSSQDNIGWDGSYALMLSYRPDPRMAFKLGVYHLSAHLGDEYIERTGRPRLSYTREELQAGMNLSLSDNLQWYVETGWAYVRLNTQAQKPWRTQSGLQYRSGESPHRVQWYAGLDIGGTEERDWQKDITFQFGWLIPSRTRTWRVGFEAYDGKAQLGEFFQDDERYIGLGLWLDI